MKKPIVLDNILLKMASQGDPTAFYSLFSHEAKEIYTSLRGSDIEHEESVSILLPFFSKVYFNLLKNKVSEPPELWFEQQKKRYLRANGSKEKRELFLEDLGRNGFQDFDNKLQATLQKEYGRIQRIKEEFNWFFRMRLALKRSFFAKTLFIILILLSIAGGIQLALLYSGTSLRIMYSSPYLNTEIKLPVRGGSYSEFQSTNELYKKPEENLSKVDTSTSIISTPPVEKIPPVKPPSPAPKIQAKTKPVPRKPVNTNKPIPRKAPVVNKVTPPTPPGSQAVDTPKPEPAQAVVSVPEEPIILPKKDTIPPPSAPPPASSGSSVPPPAIPE